MRKMRPALARFWEKVRVEDWYSVRFRDQREWYYLRTRRVR